MNVIVVKESDSSFQTIKKVLSKVDCVETVTTDFTKAELRSAHYLCLKSVRKSGFPEPSDDFSFRNVVYDMDAYCLSCGDERIQINPFSLKRKVIPKSNNAIFQLNWIFDEFFVSMDVWERVFEPFGVGKIPVLDYGTGLELPEIVQLTCNDKRVSLDIPSNHNFFICDVCGRKKYDPKIIGLHPSVIDTVEFDYAKSKESFGHGQTAFNSVIISKRLYKEISRTAIKGFKYQPLV